MQQRNEVTSRALLHCQQERFGRALSAELLSEIWSLVQTGEFQEKRNMAFTAGWLMKLLDDMHNYGRVWLTGPWEFTHRTLCDLIADDALPKEMCQIALVLVTPWSGKDPRAEWQEYLESVEQSPLFYSLALYEAATASPERFVTRSLASLKNQVIQKCAVFDRSDRFWRFRVLALGELMKLGYDTTFEALRGRLKAHCQSDGPLSQEAVFLAATMLKNTYAGKPRMSGTQVQLDVLEIGGAELADRFNIGTLG